MRRVKSQPARPHFSAFIEVKLIPMWKTRASPQSVNHLLEGAVFKAPGLQHFNEKPVVARSPSEKSLASHGSSAAQSVKLLSWYSLIAG